MTRQNPHASMCATPHPKSHTLISSSTRACNLSQTHNVQKQASAKTDKANKDGDLLICVLTGDENEGEPEDSKDVDVCGFESPIRYVYITYKKKKKKKTSVFSKKEKRTVEKKTKLCW